MNINRDNMTVSFEWGIPDVRKVIKDRGIRFKEELNDEECFKVLQLAVMRHDHNEGINYDVIEFWIFTMFRSRIANCRDPRYGYYR